MRETIGGFFFKHLSKVMSIIKLQNYLLTINNYIFKNYKTYNDCDWVMSFSGIWLHVALGVTVRVIANYYLNQYIEESRSCIYVPIQHIQGLEKTKAHCQQN